MQMKAAALRLLTQSRLAYLCRPLTRDSMIVFMMHRFADPERGVTGYDPAVVRELLALLRRERTPLVDLRTVFTSLACTAPPLRGAVAFTIDDGYQEHATVAGPLFAEFDCPVTTFVTTGFLDGDVWLWWDRVEYVFEHAKRRELALRLDDESIRYPLFDPVATRTAIEHCIERLKRIPEAAKQEAITRLAVDADVELPALPPARYAPMTWAQLRACERRGMSFAPHTVTHPILARTADGQVRHEIEHSWERVRSEAASPVPIFAYPNGRPGDFGQREFAILADLGLRAVTGCEGFASRRDYRRPQGAFVVPRLPFPDERPQLVQQISGLEHLKSLVRGIHGDARAVRTS